MRKLIGGASARSVASRDIPPSRNCVASDNRTVDTSRTDTSTIAHRLSVSDSDPGQEYGTRGQTCIHKPAAPTRAYSILSLTPRLHRPSPSSVSPSTQSQVDVTCRRLASRLRPTQHQQRAEASPPRSASCPSYLPLPIPLDDLGLTFFFHNAPVDAFAHVPRRMRNASNNTGLSHQNDMVSLDAGSQDTVPVVGKNSSASNVCINVRGTRKAVGATSRTNP